jgi:hypothetical protein
VLLVDNKVAEANEFDELYQILKFEILPAVYVPVVVNRKFVSVPDPEFPFAEILKAWIGTFIEAAQMVAAVTGVAGFESVSVVGWVVAIANQPSELPVLLELIIEFPLTVPFRLV